MSSAVKASLASLAVFVLIIVGYLLFDAFESEGPTSLPTFDAATEVADIGTLETPAGDPGREFVTGLIAKEAVKITATVLENSSGRALTKAQFRVSKSADGDRPGTLIWDSARDG